MKRIIRPLAACLFLLQIAVPAAAIDIHYSLRTQFVQSGRPGRAFVSIDVRGIGSESSLAFQMPRWSPGDYHVQNHGQYVASATCETKDGSRLDLEHPDPSTWKVTVKGRKEITLKYELPTTEPGIFSENVKISERYAFFNGPATFMYVVGHKADPLDLRFADVPAAFKLVVPLPNPAPAVFAATDYDTLADSPILIGDFKTRSFTVSGRPHTIAFFNSYEGIEYDAFVPILRKVVTEECRLMGGPPYERYVFFLDCDGRGGGLEHLNSTRIGWGHLRPAANIAEMAAHEFFHLWNVKRIRPVTLGPFDYIDPPRTRNLWFAEGVTDYYGDLSVLRSGLASEEDYLAGLGGAISRFLRTPARTKVTADEASYKVWDSAGSFGFGGLSYYQKGHLIGFCLDMKIRALTHNKSSLDHVMRDLLARYGLPKPGYPEDGIRDAVIRAAGPEMRGFYDKLTSTTEEMPFEECLDAAGLALAESGNRYSINVKPDAGAGAIEIRRDWLRQR